MMPKINPRDMQKMMQRMGINQQEIEAIEVVIKTKEKDIVIGQPSVQKINAMGQVSYQISGREFIRERELEIKEEDIAVIIDQTGISREEAISAIKAHKGDLAAVILELQK